MRESNNSIIKISNRVIETFQMPDIEKIELSCKEGGLPDVNCHNGQSLKSQILLTCSSVQGKVVSTCISIYISKEK